MLLVIVFNKRRFMHFSNKNYIKHYKLQRIIFFSCIFFLFFVKLCNANLITYIRMRIFVCTDGIKSAFLSNLFKKFWSYKNVTYLTLLKLIY